jgi:hypothetical protein
MPVFCSFPTYYHLPILLCYIAHASISLPSYFSQMCDYNIKIIFNLNMQQQ